MNTELQLPYWEWWIVVYFFAGGIAGGAYFIACMIELFGRQEDRQIAHAAYTLALPLSILCAVCLILDLGRPERFWHMIIDASAIQSGHYADFIGLKINSPISVGSYVLLGFGLFSLLSFVDMLVETGRMKPILGFSYSGLPRRIYAVLGALCGLFLASYTGVLLAHTHVPAWADTPLLGALFVASGASTGLAAIALVLGARRASLEGGAWSRVKLADNYAILLEVVLLIAIVGLLGAASAPFFARANGVLLIGGVLVLGLLLPLALQFRSGFQGAKSSPGLTMVAAALVLIGGFILRMVVVLAPQGFI